MPAKFRQMTWEKNNAEHAAEHKKDAAAIAFGKKSVWQVQIENSFIPVDAQITVDLDGFLKKRALRDD